MDNSEDQARPIPFAPGYRVYRDGRIESCVQSRGREWRLLSVSPNGNGYPTVGLKINGRFKNYPVHLAVLWAWRGAPEPGQVARHLDDVRHHYHLRNLAWGTRKENTEDAMENGRIRFDPRARKDRPLTEHELYMLRATRVMGGDVVELARQLRVPYAVALSVINAPAPVDDEDPFAELDDAA